MKVRDVISGDKPSSGRPAVAFSLVEAMIALAIFFMAAFSILTLVSTVLKNARVIQTKKGVDAGMVAAQLILTNKLTEDIQSGDFGDDYRGYSWITDTQEFSTNGLYKVDIVVQRDQGGAIESQMSILLFRPESQSRSMTGVRR